MNFLKAVHTNDWTQYNELANTNAQLEPLELRSTEEAVVIARMKKLAKDPAVNPANALDLVHMSYDEQDWERQSSIGDLVRPTPADRKAWEQYEKFIQLAVQLLSKFRGIKGEWRTDRYDTVPTNDRSSMASMAAANAKESFESRWDSTSELSQLAELFEDDESTYRIDGLFETHSIYEVSARITDDIEALGFVVLEETVNDNTVILHISDAKADIVDKVKITKS